MTTEAAHDGGGGPPAPGVLGSGSSGGIDIRPSRTTSCFTPAEMVTFYACCERLWQNSEPK